MNNSFQLKQFLILLIFPLLFESNSFSQCDVNLFTLDTIIGCAGESSVNVQVVAATDCSGAGLVSGGIRLAGTTVDIQSITLSSLGLGTFSNLNPGTYEVRLTQGASVVGPQFITVGSSVVYAGSDITGATCPVGGGFFREPINPHADFESGNELFLITSADGVSMKPTMTTSAPCILPNNNNINSTFGSNFFNLGYPLSGSEMAIGRRQGFIAGCFGEFSKIKLDFTTVNTIRPIDLKFTLNDFDNKFDSVLVQVYSGGSLVNYTTQVGATPPASSYVKQFGVSPSITLTGTDFNDAPPPNVNPILYLRGVINFTVQPAIAVDSIVLIEYVNSNTDFSTNGSAIGITNMSWTCNPSDSLCPSANQNLSGYPIGGQWSASASNPDGGVLTATTDGVANVQFENCATGDFKFIYTYAGCSDTTVLIVHPDTIAPVFGGLLPTDTLVNCDAIPMAVTLTATDNCTLNQSVTMIEDTIVGSCPNVYTLTRTWTAIDECSNVTTHIQVISVQDTIAPVFVGLLPVDTLVSCDAVPVVSILSATDNCTLTQNVVFVEDTLAGSCANAYTLTRTWTATDECNNVTTHVQTVTVQDTVAPIFVETLPTDSIVNCDAVPLAAILTATDNCTLSQNVIMTENTVSGSCPNAYTLTRTWTATDECNNATTHVQVISVQDTIAPTFVEVLPVDILVSDCEVLPTAPVLTAIDNCTVSPTVVFSETTSAGEIIDETYITRTWLVNDGCSNSNSHIQVITIKESLVYAGPDVNGGCTEGGGFFRRPISPNAAYGSGNELNLVISDDGISLKPTMTTSAPCILENNNNINSTYGSNFFNLGYPLMGAEMTIGRRASFTTGCMDEETKLKLDFTTVNSLRPADFRFSLNDIDNVFDSVLVQVYSGGVLANYTTQLGVNNGNSYVQQYGNSPSVTVTGTAYNNAPAPNVDPLLYLNGVVSFVVQPGIPVDSLVLMQFVNSNLDFSNSGSAFGITNMRWTCIKSDSLCPNSTQVLTGYPKGGQWIASNGNPLGAVLDTTVNGVANLQFNDCTSGDFEYIYVYEGCSDTVIVTVYPDSIPPIFSGCPVDIVRNGDVDICGALISWTKPVVSDNCTVSSITSSHQPNTLFDVGTTVVTYTSSDQCGNVSICEFDVVITDSQKPRISVNIDPEYCLDDLVIFNDIVSDNCGIKSTIYSHPSGSSFPEGNTVVSIKVTDVNGNDSTINFTVNVNACEITIFETFSPNNNGDNDFFYIDNIDGFPNSRVTIFNRWGIQVYHSDDYKNDWDGISQSQFNVAGNELPEGTYFYILELGGDPTDESYHKVYKGYVYLKR